MSQVQRKRLSTAPAAFMSSAPEPLYPYATPTLSAPVGSLSGLCVSVGDRTVHRS
jgi:hypothetical protein